MQNGGVRDATLDLACLARRSWGADEAQDAQRCEERRAFLASSAETVGDVFESLGGGGAVDVATESSQASSPADQGEILYRLVRAVAPVKIVEFGACFGIGASYMAAAQSRAGGGELVTIEGSPSRAAIAASTLEAVAPGTARVVVGFFDDHLEQLDGADFLFIDGNHNAEPTRLYVREAYGRMAANGLILLDDIVGYSDEMDSVWDELRARAIGLSAEWHGIGVLGLRDASLPSCRGIRRATAGVAALRVSLRARRR